MAALRFSHEASSFRECCHSNCISQIFRVWWPGNPKISRNVPRCALLACRPIAHSKCGKVKTFRTYALSSHCTVVIIGSVSPKNCTFNSERTKARKVRRHGGGGLLACRPISQSRRQRPFIFLLRCLFFFDKYPWKQKCPEISHCNYLALGISLTAAAVRINREEKKFLATVSQIGNGPLNFCHQSLS